MTTTNTQGSKNGQVRKTLASQLDRFDAILDALSEGLNEAVAMNVQEAVSVAVKQAVQVAITEVLTNPALLERLRPTSTMPVQPAAPTAIPVAIPVAQGAKGWWQTLVGGMKGVWNKTCSVVRHCLGATRALAAKASTAAGACLRAFWMRMLLAVQLGNHFRKPLVLALGVGVVIGVGCYLAGPLVASLFSGLAAFSGSLVASVMNSLRWMLASDDLSHG